MPQQSQVSQRRFLLDQSCLPGFRSMPSTDSKPRRPPIPVPRKNWTPCHRNDWSAWLGTGGRHPSESMVGMARIMQLVTGRDSDPLAPNSGDSIRFPEHSFREVCQRMHRIAVY